MRISPVGVARRGLPRPGHAGRDEIAALLPAGGIACLPPAHALLDRLLAQLVAQALAFEALAPALRAYGDRGGASPHQQAYAQERAQQRPRGRDGGADRFHALHSRQAGRRPPSARGKPCNKG